MGHLKTKMVEDMRLFGLSSSTQKVYVEAVQHLARYHGKSPASLSGSDLRKFFLHLTEEKQVSRSTFKVHLCAIKFFYEKTLNQSWHVLKIIRPMRCFTLPAILSQGEVKLILSCVKNDVYRTCLRLIYGCGLRIGEAVKLRIDDFDKDRRLITIHKGKGGKDRLVPYCQSTKEMLSAYWQRRERPYPWLFAYQTKPDDHVKPDILQKAFKLALQETGIAKKVTPHSLRHAYATHLLENGVDLVTIQKILGHKSAKTTTIYTHVTEQMFKTTKAVIEEIMNHIE